MEKSDARNLATYLLALSVFSLAVAIIYFTIEVSNISKQIPAILGAVESTSKSVEPVIEQVSEIKNLIPPILDEWTETRKQIPLILDEVKATRELVPPVLEEVGKVRGQIPPVLKEVEATRQELPAILDTSNKAIKEVAAVRKTVPDILDTSNKAIKEVAAVRKTVPDILEEVKKTREMVPSTLDRVDRMIGDARAAGRKASEGAVTGVITGIFTAPFRLVGNIGKGLGLSSAEMEGLTEDDLEVLREASQGLASKSINETTSWKNPDTGTYGNIKLLDIFKQNGRECRTSQFDVWKQGKTKISKVVTFCKNEGGSWDPVNSTDSE